MKKLVILGLSILLTLSIIGCGDSSVSSEEISRAYENGEFTIDYVDSASFEKALNEGAKVNGKIVQFDVTEYKPNSSLGIDCWSGEHLNFISTHELDVSSGDIIIGYVTKEASKVLGSWKIPYEVLEILSNSSARNISVIDDLNSQNVNDNKAITEEAKATIEDTKPEDEKKAAEEKAKTEAEKKAAEEKAKAEAEKKVTEEKAKAEAEKKAAEEKAKAEAEKKAAEEKAKAEAEKKAAEEKARAEAENTAQESQNTVTTETKSNSGGVNGDGSNFNTYNNAEQQNTSDTWVLNTGKNKKIHKPSCPSVKKIAPQNYSTSSEKLATLEAQGYTTCGNCF